MKIRGVFILSFISLIFLLSSCGSMPNPLSRKDTPKLYPIIQRIGGNEKFGYINTTGEVVIQPQFVQAWFFSEGLAVACVEREKCGYIDETGKFAINPQFQLASRFSEGLAGVVIENKIGYVDKTGKYVINPQFEMTRGPNDWQAIFSIFSEGLAAVRIAGKYGYIDKAGKIAVNPQFDIGLPFMEGLAGVKIGEKWGYIDKEGKIVVNPQFDGAHPFINGLAAAKMGNQWGYIDKTGKIVINPQFDFAAPFASEGAAVVFLKDKAGFIDKNGKYLVNPQFSIPPEAGREAEILLVAAYLVTPDLGRLSASEGLALANVGGNAVHSMKFGFVDGSGQFVINPQFRLAAPFFGELAPVMFDEEVFGWINKEGKIVWRETRETPKTATNTGVLTNSAPSNSAPVSNTAPTASQRSGRLTTDSNIRSEPNKDAASLGIHFKAAKIRILEETSYQTDTGETSTWYKIRIVEYGCSVNTNLGCGKNSPNDADEGWINSKNVLLD